MFFKKLFFVYKIFIRRIAQHCIGNGIRVFLYRLTCVKIGKYVQFNEDISVIDNIWNWMLEIGDYSNIGAGTTFVTGSGPTFPHPDMNDSYTKVKKSKIILEEGVWFGVNVVVMPGIRIGKHAIVGSSAVITKNVPPYAIVAGNPAKIIKYRESAKKQNASD